VRAQGLEGAKCTATPGKKGYLQHKLHRSLAADDHFRFVNVVRWGSLIDEHPRVIPAPRVSGNFSPMNTPAQADLGRGTLTSPNDGWSGLPANKLAGEGGRVTRAAGSLPASSHPMLARLW
jgi:hypothetical protein